MEKNNQTEFLLEMSERAISVNEFFSTDLLDSIERHFGYRDTFILCFDAENNFLSWINRTGLYKNYEGHPYRKFAPCDIVGQQIYRDSFTDHLTYFNVKPRIYKATDIISVEQYDDSAYVHFLEENFHAHYSVRFAMGINAYLQIVFHKSREAGDFSDTEMAELSAIYSCVASAYRNFKKYEQSRIISNIQNEIMRQESMQKEEAAYFITDALCNVMYCNSYALTYLRDVLGCGSLESIEDSNPSVWLPFLLSDRDKCTADKPMIHTIRNHVFTVHVYNQGYSHGIVDQYYWITISGDAGVAHDISFRETPRLTKCEKRIASMLYDGMTYQNIADEICISYHTVKNHVQNIYAKCGINNRHELYELMKRSR